MTKAAYEEPENVEEFLKMPLAHQNLESLIGKLSLLTAFDFIAAIPESLQYSGSASSDGSGLSAD